MDAGSGVARLVHAVIAVLIVASASLFVGGQTSAVRTFVNPILQHGQDPSVVYAGRYYYLVQSDGARIEVYRAASLTHIAEGVRVTVFGPTCCQVWAPELIPLDGRWYIYYAASNGDNASHRMYVLESAGANPLGPYHLRGKVAAATDRWAIDGTVLQIDRARYFVWSGWEGLRDGQQNLYIARMSNPWTISGDRSLLSAPTNRWEQATVGPHIRIEEGPEALHYAGRTFLVFSANGSWSDDYCLGLLTYTGGEVTSLRSWSKSAGCIFAKAPTASVYGPGHASFTTSPDDASSWIVYHAISRPGGGWSDRSVRAQRYTWAPDGTPAFGVPAPLGQPLPRPSGEPLTS